MKNTLESVIELDKPCCMEGYAGHQDTKQMPGYHKCIYQPQ